MALRQPFMEVIYEVHHITDQPGYLVSYLAKPNEAVGPDQADPFAETLTSSANGLGLVVVTRSGFPEADRPQPDPALGPCIATEIEQGRVFRGAAHPNPSFNYESARQLEGLICIDENSIIVREWHSRALMEIVGTIARMAHAAQAPIISMQAPAQVPPSDAPGASRSTAAREPSLPLAASLAVRFAIAMPNPMTSTLLGFTDELVGFCAERGFGVWVRDARPDTRLGNWSQLLGADPQRSSALYMKKAGTDPVRACVPITLVGPARVGATLSLMSLLRKPQIGTAACSVVALDDLLFVHVQMVVTGMPSEQVLDLGGRCNAQEAISMQPSDALGQILAGLPWDDDGLRDAPADMPDAREHAKLTDDYQCLIGPPQMLPDSSCEDRMALWFCWQAQEHSLSTPLRTLFDALADVRLATGGNTEARWQDTPNIEYLVCRNMGNSVLRGRGKLSVPRDTALSGYPDNEVESRPAALCADIEGAWRARTARNPDHAVRELTVAWRENWLGHWSLPL